MDELWDVFCDNLGENWQRYSSTALYICPSQQYLLNTLRPRQNSRYLADNIFKCIFLNENVWFPIKISLEFAPEGLINNIPALVHIMAWRRPGDKPLSEPMMASLPTHVCVALPQWVNVQTFYIKETVHTYNWGEFILVRPLLIHNFYMSQMYCIWGSGIIFLTHLVRYLNPLRAVIG